MCGCRTVTAMHPLMRHMWPHTCAYATATHRSRMHAAVLPLVLLLLLPWGHPCCAAGCMAARSQAWCL